MHIYICVHIYIYIHIHMYIYVYRITLFKSVVRADMDFGASLLFFCLGGSSGNFPACL